MPTQVWEDGTPSFTAPGLVAPPSKGMWAPHSYSLASFWALRYGTPSSPWTYKILNTLKHPRIKFLILTLRSSHPPTSMSTSACPQSTYGWVFKILARYPRHHKGQTKKTEPEERFIFYFPGAGCGQARGVGKHNAENKEWGHRCLAWAAGHGGTETGSPSAGRQVADVTGTSTFTKVVEFYATISSKISVILLFKCALKMDVEREHCWWLHHCGGAPFHGGSLRFWNKGHFWGLRRVWAIQWSPAADSKSSLREE